MKHLEEYRDPEIVEKLVATLARETTGNWTIMEICGGQTHAILRFGLDQMLPAGIRLVHGPGCPVCVTPVGMIDRAIQAALRPDTLLCSFGDMLRVPGTSTDLFHAKAQGGDVRMVYSPLDALSLAREHPEKEVVFFAVGFETTAPAHAMTVLQAEREQVKNFSLLVSHVTVPAAITAILSAPDNQVQGFLAAGHVCTVEGYADYEHLASRFGVPIVVTGFEPVDILLGIHRCVAQLERGSATVENAYARVVEREGNSAARAAVNKVFQVVDREWRGLGCIPGSGLGLRKEYAGFDACSRMEFQESEVDPTTECLSGEILKGLMKPVECPAFGTRCTPERPLGATMVSSEGACAAYYRYRRMS